MTGHYSPPLQDHLFLLDKVLDWEKLFALPEFVHVDPETATAVLTEGARFSADVLSPINQSGDEQGCRLDKGRVVTPDGFADAFQSFAEGGWPGLDLPDKYGGQNLPLSIQVAFSEMINGACVSFGMLPIMLRAAAWLLIEHAEDVIVNKTVPNLTVGKWAATICISEPQAGSDAGRIRTKAVETVDGRYALTGTKIFISYADHDFTEQIIHMILARAPEAPPGTSGLSLFMVPNYDLDDKSKSNGISISRVEKKMGLKASPTCVMDLDGAIGYRIGLENEGLKCMFSMVNLMRLEVAIQGVAMGGAVAQLALDYAEDRPQGGNPNQAPIAIIEHADVRRMLFIIRARTEAMRALVFEAAFNLDMARAAEDENERINSRRLAEFLLPVCKTCAAETGFEVASLAVQVFGGHGYISDAGVEQYLRDSRVMSIYEGTSGIQALDLVARKLIKDSGTRYQLFIGRIKQDLEHCSEAQDLDEIHRSLNIGLECLGRCTNHLQKASTESIRDVEAAATDYLRLVGLVAGAWMWLRMVAATENNSKLHQGKKAYAKFYAQYLMPEMHTLELKIYAGISSLDKIDNETLTNY